MNIRTARSMGAFVHQRRTELGWSQARLAAEVGVSRAWVNEFEGGKGSVQMRLVLDALSVLGLVMDVVDDPREPRP